jgi:hypothetical protein
LRELHELRELRDVNYVWIRELREIRLGGCPAWEKAGELLLPRCGRAVVAELWASSCCRCVGELLLPRCVGEFLLPLCGRALVAVVWVHDGVDERDVRVFAKGCEKGR